MQRKIQILFDGNCKICDWEISHYKRKAPDLFELVDISDPDFNASFLGLNQQAVSKHMHVIDSNGAILIGVDAFICIWQQIPSYRRWAQITQLPFIYSSSKLGYEIFVKIRPFLPKKSNKIS